MKKVARNMLKSPKAQNDFDVKLAYLEKIVPFEIERLGKVVTDPYLYINKIVELFKCHTAYYTWPFKSHSIGLIRETFENYEVKTVTNVAESCALGKVFDNCLIDPSNWKKYHLADAMLLHIKKKRKHHGLVTLEYGEDSIEIEDVLGFNNEEVDDSTSIQTGIARILFKRVPPFVEINCQTGFYRKLSNKEVVFYDRRSDLSSILSNAENARGRALRVYDEGAELRRRRFELF